MLVLPQGDFDAYLFDCDGTLADSMPIHYRAWCHALREMEAPFSISEKYYNALGGIPTIEFVRYMNREFGADLDPDRTAAIKKQYYLDHVEETKAIAPVVDYAKKMGRDRVAVVSGGLHAMLKQTLRVIDFDGHYSVIVAAEDTERGKPAPDPFLLAAEKLGVKPERCLVFEDTPIGFEAARAAGMQYVAVNAALFRSHQG